MATVNVTPEEAKSPSLEITRQNFFQEAKTLIAQHHERINENKFQGPSINVFINKHQKLKSGKYIPLEITKKEEHDVVQEHRTVLRNIGLPKKLSKSEHFEEPPQQQTSLKMSHVFNIKEKCQPIDLITKEQVKMGKIMTDIESVSKKMEKEKQHILKSRMLESLDAFPVLPGLSLQLSTSSSLGLPRETGKALYDWRGVVASRSFRLYHDSSRSFSGSSALFQDYCNRTFRKKKKQHPETESDTDMRMKYTPSKSDKLDSKVKRIGPHIEIYQVFREKSKVKMNKRTIKMVTVMQAHVRGWLERKRLQRLTTKALYHGPNLKAVINMYRRVIHRIRHRLGLWRTREIINFAEVEEWMDRKKFYETKFAKREDWHGLERSELLKYFNECGHFPTQKQVDDCWELFNKDKQPKYPEVAKKTSAIEMVFTLYPPLGAHAQKIVQMKSTWLRPIVDGEEGHKYIVSGHPVLKKANIRIVAKLVANSIRERKLKQHSK